MLFTVLFALLIVAASAYFVFGKGDSGEKEKPARNNDATEEELAPTNRKKKKGKKKSIMVSNPVRGGKKKKKAGVPSHPRFLNMVKGHSQNIDVCALSPNGKWLATSGGDQQLRVTQVNSGSKRVSGGEAIYFRINIDRDTISSLSWASDSSTIVAAMEGTKDVCYFRMRKNKNAAADGSGFKYELIELKKRRFSTAHKGPVQSCIIDTAYSSPVIVTAGDVSADKSICVWGNDGMKLGQVSNPYSSQGVRLSTDGHFIAPRCDSTEIKLFEIVRKKVKGQPEAMFEAVNPKSVMTLSGLHKKKVTDVVFGGHDAPVAHGDCDRCVTCGLDGSIGIWGIDVHFKFKEDPKLLWGGMPHGDAAYSKIALSPDGRRLAASTFSGDIHLFTIKTVGEETCKCTPDIVIESKDAGGTGLKYMEFSPSCQELYTCGIMSKHAYVWDVKKQ